MVEQENYYQISSSPITDPGGYIAGQLLSAIEMEDHVSADAYAVFLESSTWPSEMPADVLDNIRRLVTTLIDQTDRHKHAFRQLQDNLA